MKETEPDFADNVGLLLTNFIWWWVETIKGFLFMCALITVVGVYIKMN